MNHLIRVLLCGAILPTIIACEKKPQSTGEKIQDGVNDALDRRPGEKARDAGEDLKDAAKDAKDAVKDAVKE